MIANLEKTPIEERKPIYQNVIKFAEIHANKVKLGLYAPTKGMAGPDDLKATGTEHFKFSDCEPKNRFLVNRGGSTTVTIGAANLRSFELHVFR